MIHRKKGVQDVLQEEMVRERVAVLARAGERLADALAKLEQMEGEIAEGVALWQRGSGALEAAGVGTVGEKQRLAAELNEKIRGYNSQREEVRTRFYYLIVTREALGIIHHQRLEETYRIPPPKRLLAEKGKR